MSQNSYSFIKVGNKIELTRINENRFRKLPSKKFVSQFLDIIEDDRAKIAMPLEGGRVVPLSKGEKYNMCIYTERGLYECKCQIIDRLKDQSMFLLDIKITSELQKFQRREYFRLEYLIDIRYHVITKEELLCNKMLLDNKFESPAIRQECEKVLADLQKVMYLGTVIDLSGGGAKFQSTNLHQKDEILKIYLELETDEGNRRLELVSKIIYANPNRNLADRYEYRLQFVGIQRETREAIIKFVFTEDRKRRRKQSGF